jgi:hypothetical protein
MSVAPLGPARIILPFVGAPSDGRQNDDFAVVASEAGLGRYRDGPLNCPFFMTYDLSRPRAETGWSPVWTGQHVGECT